MSSDRLIIETEQNGKQVQVIEKASFRELYIDGIHGAMVNGDAGVVKLNLYSQGYPSETEGEVERREVSDRLVCNLNTFLSISDFLAGIAEDIRANKQGSDGQEGEA